MFLILLSLIIKCRSYCHRELKRIHALSNIGMSSQDIVRILKDQNINVSQRSVSNVVINKGIMREATVNGQRKPKYRRPVKIRTSEIIRKVQRMASQCNPPSLKCMAIKIETSDTTIGKMIHSDNHMVTRI